MNNTKRAAGEELVLKQDRCFHARGTCSLRPGLRASHEATIFTDDVTKLAQ